MVESGGRCGGTGGTGGEGEEEGRSELQRGMIRLLFKQTTVNAVTPMTLREAKKKKRKKRGKKRQLNAV